MSRKTANRPGSLDYETTHGVYRIGPGEACRAKPARGAASEMSPSPTLLPCPCGSAPFETHRGSHLCGSRCRDVISPSEGVHAVSAQQCSFGRGVASGPQVSVALPALRPVAPRDALRLLWLGALLVGRRSDAANMVARGTRHPSWASHTDISSVTGPLWSIPLCHDPVAGVSLLSGVGA